MKSPPAGVKLVMEAICILKGVKPDRINDPSGSGTLISTLTAVMFLLYMFIGKKIEDFWGPSKKILGDMQFLKSLHAYDKVSVELYHYMLL